MRLLGLDGSRNVLSMTDKHPKRPARPESSLHIIGIAARETPESRYKGSAACRRKEDAVPAFRPLDIRFARVLDRIRRMFRRTLAKFNNFVSARKYHT